ncbi:hypothetical protein [Kutzneria sp. NPDC052558]|uniref:hypothetical protein n=1 Tax=Kutzneria sp. NPDC052558 TaxID=3364121 RepID=UPI0037CAB939
MVGLGNAARVAWWLGWTQLAGGFWVVGTLSPADGPGDAVFLAFLLAMGLVPALPGVYLAWRTRRRPRTWLLLLEASILYAGWHVMAAGTALGWWRTGEYETMRRGGHSLIQMPGPLGVTAGYHAVLAAGFLAVVGLILAAPKPGLVLPKPIGADSTRSSSTP